MVETSGERQPIPNRIGSVFTKAIALSERAGNADTTKTLGNQVALNALSAWVLLRGDAELYLSIAQSIAREPLRGWTTRRAFAIEVQEQRPNPAMASSAEALRVYHAPSTVAIAISTAIVAALGGFFLGQATSLGLFGEARSKHKATMTKSHLLSPEDEDEKGSETEEENPHDLTTSNEECKLVLVVRTDLGMTKGKIAAQCSHATLACYKALLGTGSPLLHRWERQGQAKVALQVRSEEELELLQAQAVSLGIVAQVIHDAGRTQIAAGSATVLGIGPAPKNVVDQVTGSLKLL
ncbi:MAG: hypothetical protein M1840_004753 [Geoglossum simile]|nr:MAG: hypothetical protein M1840_004753 [Geoglossum simile]